MAPSLPWRGAATSRVTCPAARATVSRIHDYSHRSSHESNCGGQEKRHLTAGLRCYW